MGFLIPNTNLNTELLSETCLGASATGCTSFRSWPGCESLGCVHVLLGMGAYTCNSSITVGGLHKNKDRVLGSFILQLYWGTLTDLS